MILEKNKLISGTLWLQVGDLEISIERGESWVKIEIFEQGFSSQMPLFSASWDCGQQKKESDDR